MERGTSLRHYSLAASGFELVTGAIARARCAEIAHLLDERDSISLGSRRLLDQPWCRELAVDLRRHPRIAALIPEAWVVAQCTLFEKSRATNWLVPLHQDLSIPVRERVEHPELAGWSIKEEGHFVQPPAELLAMLVAVRLHIDPCNQQDGPLRVVPGSHRAGKLSPEASVELRNRSGETSCIAEAGDALLLRPLLLHASSKATGSSQRRVLHFLWGPPALPCGLSWPAS